MRLSLALPYWAFCRVVLSSLRRRVDSALWAFVVLLGVIWTRISKSLPYLGLCGTITAGERGGVGRAHEPACRSGASNSDCMGLGVLDRTPAGIGCWEKDRGIDRLVYELYELTDEEIWIVEEATGG